VDDEPAAAAREADVVVALRPPHNAALAQEGRWTFVVVGEGPGGDVVLRTTADPDGHGRARVNGCFPHLGKGVASVRGTGTSDGYGALVRLLWAASAAPGERVPARLAGPSAPIGAEVAVALPDELRRPLLAFLRGSSARLLDPLAAEAVARRDAYQRPGIERDLGTARSFFVHGSRPMHDLRRRHGIDSAAPVTRRQFEEAISAEVRAAIGDFVVESADDVVALAGRRARRWRAD
jgi:hypothetical protein